ncbi:CHAT domain-containing protein [Micromonospora sp. ATA32]|nr:CHAT domain-containing protein [Micromonospora sp. ATA32]
MRRPRCIAASARPPSWCRDRTPPRPGYGICSPTPTGCTSPATRRRTRPGHRTATSTLHDGPLRVRELLRPPAGVRTARTLAYLSACSTLQGGARLPDENIHIASALQLAGFAHVIATYWPVPDPVAGRAARLIYGGLHAGRPAHAVNAATLALQDRYRGRRPAGRRMCTSDRTPSHFSPHRMIASPECHDILGVRAVRSHEIGDSLMNMACAAAASPAVPVQCASSP